MRRALTITFGIATVHFLIMFFTNTVTIGHDIGEGVVFNLFGKAPTDTALTQLTRCTSAVLNQPLDFILSKPLVGDPAGEPREPTAIDEILGWLFYSLNSLLWGGLIYLVWFCFENRLLKQEPARQVFSK